MPNSQQPFGYPLDAPVPEQLLDAAGIRTLVESIVEQILSLAPDGERACLIGTQSRGDILARRIQHVLKAQAGLDLACGSLDITLYRDDFDSLSEQPLVGHTEIPFAIEGMTVFLIDDVLFTGRTVRAALDEIIALGRPARVVLMVLVDRGWRELPIAPDFAGLTLQTAHADQVQLLLHELDGRDELQLFRRGQPEHG
jgi:pyrimidine operon attenuation protein/uracil phosphoribosyltransferase